MRLIVPGLSGYGGTGTMAKTVPAQSRSIQAQAWIGAIVHAAQVAALGPAATGVSLWKARPTCGLFTISGYSFFPDMGCSSSSFTHLVRVTYSSWGPR